MTPNLTAFLAVIAQCEVGTTGPDGYRKLYGGSLFDSFADHPRQAFMSSWGWTSAAGRYQAMCAVPGKVTTDTWGDFIRSQGPHDFSHESQDLFARWCITRRGATADVEAGRIPEAIAKCNREWASLPGSPYGQPTRTLEYCLQVYAANGGLPSSGATEPNLGIHDRPPFVFNETRKTMGATLLASLLPSILGMFSGKAQQAIQRATGASPDAAATFAQDLLSRVGVAVGIPVTDDASAIRAAAAAQTLPAATVKALEDSAVSLAVVEAGGGGIGGARETYAAIARDYDDDVWWRIPLKFFFNPVHWVTGVFLFYVQQFVPPIAATIPSMSKEAVLGLAVTIIGVLALVGAYWLGTYLQKQKD